MSTPNKTRLPRTGRDRMHRNLLATIAPSILLSSGAASAQTYGYDFQMGGGHLSAPNNVALDPSTRNVFVTDGANNNVVVFDASGTYLNAFGGSGTGNGRFSFPTGLRVDATVRACRSG